jgi:hypothetical protein
MKFIRNFSRYKELQKIYEYATNELPPNNVQQAIKLLRKGAYGPGTDPVKLREAISELTSKADFDILENYMKNNPRYFGISPGYSSLQELLRGELDEGNFFTAEQIANHLACIGVVMSYAKDPKHTTNFLLNPTVNIFVPSNDSKKGPNTIFGKCTNNKILKDLFAQFEGSDVKAKFAKNDPDSSQSFYSCFIYHENSYKEVCFFSRWDGQSTFKVKMYGLNDQGKFDTFIKELVLNEYNSNKKLEPNSQFQIKADEYIIGKNSTGVLSMKFDLGHFIIYSYDEIKDKIPPTNKTNPSSNNYCTRCKYRFKGYQECAKNIQQALYDLGKEYQDILKTSKNNGVDGLYGQKTCQAISLFQKNNNLTPDGCWGPETAKKYQETHRKSVPPCGTKEEPQVPAQGKAQNQPQEPQKQAQGKAPNQPQEPQKKDQGGA